MFEVISDTSSQKLGIDVHKLTFYKFGHGLLAGGMVHDSTTTKFNVYVEPNYDLMEKISPENPILTLRQEFDRTRTHTISLGCFPTPEDAEYAVTTLENFYRNVLKVKGAKKRVLIDSGPSLSMILADKANDTRYGEAILQAINARVFSSLNSNEPLNHRDVVGKIIPAYLQALGFKEYYVTHDLSKDGFGKVSFTLVGHYTFEFYEPLKEGGLPYFERYGFRHGRAILNASNELTSDSLKQGVLDFLYKLAQDLDLFKEEDAHAAATEKAMDVRPNQTIILNPNAQKPQILGLTAPLPAATIFPFTRRPH